jgi:hypothetical protein
VALRIPNPAIPGYSSVNNASLFLSGAAFLKDADLMPVPQVIAAAGNFTTDPILVAGYNSFMVSILVGAGPGTLTMQYFHCDPTTQALLFSTQVAAGLNPAVTTNTTFGAFSQQNVPTSGDVFHTIALRFLAVAGQVTISSLILYLGVR